MASNIIINTTGTNTATTSTYWGTNTGTNTILAQNTNVNFVVSGGYKAAYVILGEEVSINGYKDIQLASCIAQINILGKPYYDELIKQGITFSDEIEKVLNRKFIELERDRKIDLVTKKD
jgi:hypothetical protein